MFIQLIQSSHKMILTLNMSNNVQNNSTVVINSNEIDFFNDSNSNVKST